MPKKHQTSIDVTAIQDFSYAVPGPKGPISQVVKTGDHLNITETEAYHWLRKRLIVEGKLDLVKGPAKKPNTEDKK